MFCHIAFFCQIRYIVRTTEYSDLNQDCNYLRLGMVQAPVKYKELLVRVLSFTGPYLETGTGGRKITGWLGAFCYQFASIFGMI